MPIIPQNVSHTITFEGKVTLSPTLVGPTSNFLFPTIDVNQNRNEILYHVYHAYIIIYVVDVYIVNTTETSK